MLATLGGLDNLGDDQAWSFEMKWDGVRALVYADSGRLKLLPAMAST